MFSARRACHICASRDLSQGSGRYFSIHSSGLKAPRYGNFIITNNLSDIKERAGRPGSTKRARLVQLARISDATPVALATKHPTWRLEVHTAAHLFAFRQQFRMARSAHVLVGAHGASLTNALFMRDASAVVEVLNCGHRSNTYRRLATPACLCAATPSGNYEERL